LEGWGQNFEEAIHWKVGTGKDVLFWKDNWVFEWEKQLAGLLSQEVQGVSFNLDKEDRWVWKEREEFGYTVKSVYLRLRGTK